jgi:Zn-dependent protease
MSREEPSWWKLPGPAEPDDDGVPAAVEVVPVPPVQAPTPVQPPTAVEPPPYEKYMSDRKDQPVRDLLRRIWAPVAALLGAALKFGFLSLKFFGIFIAVGGYALIWGWKFAVGFVGLILVHELGHFVEAKRQGLDPSLPVFIPFFGAFVALKGARFDPWPNALVSLAGPIAGTAGAAVVFAVGKSHHSQLLLALAYTGFLLNLFNLIPVGFLDGGHILRSVRVLLSGQGRTDPAESRQLGFVAGALYAGLAVALVLGMMASHVAQHRL